LIPGAFIYFKISASYPGSINSLFQKADAGSDSSMILTLVKSFTSAFSNLVLKQSFLLKTFSDALSNELLDVEFNPLEKI